MHAVDRRVIAPRDRRQVERRIEARAIDSRDQRLRLVEQSAGIGTFDLDCMTGLASWSPELRAMAGLSPGDKPISMAEIESLLHPDDRERVLGHLHAALAARETTEIEESCRLLRPDGSVRWVQINGRTFFAGAATKRRPVVATGVVIDVTAKHTTEVALAQRRAELMALVESAMDAIMEIDTGHRIVLFNRAACRMFGCQAKEALGTPLERFISSQILEATREHLRQVVEDGVMVPLVDQPMVFDGRRVNGQTFPIEVSIAKVEVEGEWRVTLTIQDLTERREAEEMMQRLRAELDQYSQFRDGRLPERADAQESCDLRLQQFAHVAVHDLQAPLRSIKGFAAMLRDEYYGRLDNRADTWLGYLLRSSLRMQVLIEDLLTYSRVDARERVLERTDLGLLFDDVVIALDAEIRETGARVTRDPDLPAVFGDAIQLGQVLQNLVGNGIKYHGKKPPRVHVSAHREGHEWLVSVTDNGIGIPQAALDDIFELFQRLHSPQEYPGSGIGLAVCRRIVQRHGGRIWAESLPGEGSVFCFTVPDRQDNG